MTKMRALYSFFSSFGIPAYEENSIYSGNVELPYITYGINTASFPASNVPIPASIWYRSASWKEIQDKVMAINATLKNGGASLPCDGGFILLKRENDREADLTGDPSDKLVKRAILHIVADFNTID
ncbi:MAG: hypothetical protein IJH64_00550 [Oscillospiraceae bacterium]|nr:hypothetical protein [Oscillospiraceae bacterium]